MATNILPVVPFGKYKGKCVTEMMADSGYVEWVKRQNILEKYPTINNIIINPKFKTNDDSPTPEHNRMQNLFLKKENQFKLVEKILRLPIECNKIISYLDKIFKNPKYIDILGSYFGEKCISTKVTFEQNNWDLKLEFSAKANGGDGVYYTNFDYKWDSLNKDIKDWITNLEQITCSEAEKSNIKPILFLDKEFNICDKDTNFIKLDFSQSFYARDLEAGAEQKKKYKFIEACLTPSGCIYHKDTTSHYLGWPSRATQSIGKHLIYAEIKPTVGDEYPCILRKMLTQIKLTSKLECRYPIFVLIIGELQGEITKENLIEIFEEQHNIKVIFIDEVLTKNLAITENNDNSLQSEEIIRQQNEKIKKLKEENQELKEENQELKEKNQELEEIIQQHKQEEYDEKESDEEEFDVEEFVFEGKEYYKSDDNRIFNMETVEYIGIYDPNLGVIIT